MKKESSYMDRRSVQAGILTLLVVLGLGLRVAYIFVSHAWGAPPSDDGIEYQILGSNLAAGKGYVTPAGDAYVFRPPGYPFFLAAIYAVTGPNPDAARLANALVSALTCLPVYGFVRRLWNWKAGLIAAVGIAFHPLLIYLVGLIYPESLTVCLVALSFYLTQVARQSSRAWPLLLLAATLAELIYVRPNLLIWVLTLVLWAIAAFSTLRSRVRAAVIVVGGAVLLVAPWSLRNAIAFDEFTWISTNGGVTFWASNNPLADGGWIEPSAATWQGVDPPADLRGWPDLSPQESERRFQARGMQWVRENPDAFLALMPRKLARAFELSFGNESRQMNLPGAVQGLYYGFLGVCLLGAVVSWRQWRDLLPLYLLALAFLGSTLVYYGSTRQTAVLIPAMIVFAAKAILWAVEGLLRIGRKNPVVISS